MQFIIRRVCRGLRYSGARGACPSRHGGAPQRSYFKYLWLGFIAGAAVCAQERSPLAKPTNAPPAPQWWNFHLANTDIGEVHPAFHAQYSGPNSLSSHAASVETVNINVLAGLRLWRNAEFHVDGLVWQGFGFDHTVGIEAFPNAEAYKVGARLADASLPGPIAMSITPARWA